MKTAIFIVGLLGVVIFAISCIQEKSQAEIEEIVKRIPIWKQVNSLCSDLPKPDDFVFVNKKISGNTNTAALSFNFRSKKRPREIADYYISWAKDNNWVVEKDNWYRKGKQSIGIKFEAFDDSNVHFYCALPIE